MRLAALLIALLLLAGGLEKLERHSHGPFSAGHECAACQVAGTPADLSLTTRVTAEVQPPDPGAVLPGVEAHAPDALIPALVHLRGPPLT